MNNIIAISGSPRNKSTNEAIRTILKDHKYDLILLKDLQISDCKACEKSCRDWCLINDDIQEIHKKLENADIIIFGSPAYFDNVTSLMKKFIDRCLPFYLSGKLKWKKAILISVGNYRAWEISKWNTDIDLKVWEESVQKCISALQSFCNHVWINVIWSVGIANKDFEAQKEKMIELGKTII